MKNFDSLVLFDSQRIACPACGVTHPAKIKVISGILKSKDSITCRGCGIPLFIEINIQYSVSTAGQVLDGAEDIENIIDIKE